MATTTTRGARVPTDVFLPAAGTKPPSGAGSGKIMGVNKWVFIGAVGVALVAAYLLYRHYQGSSSSSSSTPATDATTNPDASGLVGDQTGNGAGSGGPTGTNPTGPPVTPAPAFDTTGIGTELDAIYAELAGMQTGTSTAKTGAGSSTGLSGPAGAAALAPNTSVTALAARGQIVTPQSRVNAPIPGAGTSDTSSGIAGLGGASGGSFVPSSRVAPNPVVIPPAHEAISPRLAKKVNVAGTTSNSDAVKRSRTLH